MIHVTQMSSDITSSDTLFSPDWKSNKKKLERGNGKIINGRALEGGEVRASERGRRVRRLDLSRAGSKPNKLAPPRGRAVEI